jgi:ferric-dicitrate binding protein FerR (iron transport regulator)
MADSSRDFDVRRLAELVAAKCNGVITGPEYLELEAMLSQSAHARAEYWEAMAFDVDLEWELSGRGACDEVLSQVLLENHIAGNDLLTRPRHASNALGWLGALAACLLVALFGSWWLWRSDTKAPRNQLAVVEPVEMIGQMKPLVEGSRWSFGHQGKVNHEVISRGDTVSVDRGAVELRFSSDTVAVLEAPLVMQVMSVDRVRVIMGNIKVEVAEGAEGFAVETATAEVIDLGTVFAVNVKDGNTDLVVYDGQVDLKLAGTDAANKEETVTKRFRAGEAVHVNDDGTLSRIVDVRRTQFDGENESRKPVIAAVKDNYVREDFWSFYEIVPSGMKEDAKAFVDRTHEWNGATLDGIPSYLLGADYVKTFCDDKVTPDLSIELELLRPATVYVFLDDRLTLPEWVLEKFQDTSDEIGIDESFPERGHDPKVGPGKGIERTFSIWKRVSEVGTVYLGPNGNPTAREIVRGVDAQLAMYGIAVVPLDGVD